MQLLCQAGMVAMHELLYCRSPDICGGCAGLYVFGQTGAAIKNDRVLQVETSDDDARGGAGGVWPPG